MSAYAETTHSRLVGAACRAVLMVGRATLTIVVSSRAMNAPTSTIETARQPCPAGGLAWPSPA